MPKVILSQKEERRSFIIALAYLSDFILFAKSHLIAEGRGNNRSWKREEVLWFIFRFYLILYHLPKVILSQKEEGRSFMVYLPFLSDFVPFAKSHLIAEGRKKKFYYCSCVFI
ncbi:MAG: hypothetical protein F6K23_15225 [Okeania sp. SIO2C9]|uniref:hypothetical protein n=1 Tax=Okeania sp. SIO2C9 TaxID=2607791 RepID=UPI0013C18105|nr:hypothetical protein [Okeania sp. SIO2C9]NEQ74269.1 hypothetical protein [Okeania sp. SIO2C9]